MMKIYCLLLLLLSVSGFALGNPIENIKKRGSLEISIYGKPSPPFLIQDKVTKSWTGLDIDIAKAMAKELGVKLVINDRSKTFDSVVDKVNAKEADLAISKLSLTSKRAQKVIFSEPYIRLGMGVVYNRLSYIKLKKQSKARFFNQAHVKVGVLKGSAFTQFVKNRFPKSKMVLFKNRDEIYKSLANGKIDFTLADEASIAAWRKSFPSLNLRASYSLVKDSHDLIGIAFPQESFILRDWVNIFLTELQNSGRMNLLKEKYSFKKNWRLK